MYATSQTDKCTASLLRSALAGLYSSREIAAVKAQLDTWFATSLVGSEYITVVLSLYIRCNDKATVSARMSVFVLTLFEQIQ